VARPLVGIRGYGFSIRVGRGCRRVAASEIAEFFKKVWGQKNLRKKF